MNELLHVGLLQQLVHENERNRLNMERRLLRDNSDPFQLNDTIFTNYYRVSKEVVRQLIQQIRPHMQRVRRRTAIPLELKVLSVLYFFGHGSFQKCIGLHMDMPLHQTTFSKILSEITNVMTEQLLPLWVKFPQNENERNAVKQRFMQKFQFPGIIGAIDCTHIAIIAPATEDPIRPGLAYYNRKGYYSINLQLICDADLRILNCNARHPGSVHDSAIWSLSPLKRYTQQQFVSGNLNSACLIGDSGYPLQPWLLTPIQDAEEGTAEANYTNAHIRSRNTYN